MLDRLGGRPATPSLSSWAQTPTLGGSGKFDESKHPRDHGKFSSQPGAKGVQPPAQPSISSDSGEDHAARHAFTKQQLGSVDDPLRGVMAALHAHPDVQNGGSTVTQAFAPEQAQQAYNHLRQSAVAPQNGLGAVGQAIDLGGGKVGYASAAGSIVISPPDSSGKHQIKYTNQTGVVRRAMGGQAAGPGSQNPPGTGPSSRQGQDAGPAAAPGLLETSTPGPSASSRVPTGEKANPVPPPVPPPVITKPPTSLATQSQYDAAAVLMEKPQAATPAPAKTPETPATPRHAADQARDQLRQATERWQQEVSGGLTPKGNARWRSYTAALRSIWQQHEQLARDWEKQSKGGGKSSSGKSTVPGKTRSAEPDDELSAMEQRISEYDPNALAQVRELTQRPESYRDMVQQYHDALFPDQAKRPPSKRQPKPTPNEAERPLLSDPQAGGSGNSPEGGSGSGSISGMGSAMTDNMYEALWKKAQAGETEEGGAPSALLQVAKAARAAGGVQTPEHFRALAKAYGDVKSQGLKGEEYQAAMKDLVKQHSGGSESSAMDRLGIEPKTGKPRETKSQIEARLRREAAAGIAPEVPKPVQPKPLEGSDKWKRLVKQKASEWDMKPNDFHDLANDLHRELVEHHGQRKEAYLHARKGTGLAPADIARLENEGFDSGSKHQDIKQLDTIGRDLASQYPALGWGRGREDDSNDEGDIDYAAKVWDLIKEGYQPPPGKHSSGFMDHVEDYLRQQMKSHGSSGTAGGHAAEGEDLSAVPFAKLREGLVVRYRKWLARDDDSLTLETSSR